MNKRLAIFLKGLIAENPVLVLVLGTCPTLAVSGSVIGAISMGIVATIVLTCSNIVISALRKIIPDVVRIPCYIVVIAAFVTMSQLSMQAFLPELYEKSDLGVYFALIVVNCIILGRAEMFARKNPILDSALDGLGMGLGFLLALLAMAIIREVLGAGSFAGIEIPFMQDYKLSILTMAPGGFLVFGILIAVVNCIGPKKGSEKRKGSGCEGCPSASLCGKISCNDMLEVTEDINNQADTTVRSAAGKSGEEVAENG